MKTEVVLDLKRITAEVAARHGMLVMPDDPAMLLVTMKLAGIPLLRPLHRLAAELLEVVYEDR